MDDGFVAPILPWLNLFIFYFAAPFLFGDSNFFASLKITLVLHFFVWKFFLGKIRKKNLLAPFSVALQQHWANTNAISCFKWWKCTKMYKNMHYCHTMTKVFLDLVY